MAEAKSNKQSEVVDVTNCDREQIHIPGRVQSFGCLIAVTSDWIFSHASNNVSQMLGLELQTLQGLPLHEVISGDAIHDIRSRLQILTGPDSVERIFGLNVGTDDQRFDVAVHKSGRSIVMEFEPASSEQRKDFVSYVRPMIDRVDKADTVEKLSSMAARQIKAITGLDRVMVYRFAADGTGEVIAEARNNDLEPFLGLRYPASDIPKQARALYERNLLRIIADVDDEGIVVEPTLDPDGNPLDLSMSTTRAVSPIHLEYLKNMGVGASMSISILRRGKLWGMFACHHGSALVVSYEMRTALELFAQLYSYILDQMETDREQEIAVQSKILHDQVMSQLAEGSTISENFDEVVNAVKDVIPFDGVVGWLDGEFRSVGQVPSKEEFAALLPFLNTTAAGQVYSTNCLAKHYPKAEDFSSRAAGLLALPVSRTPRDYIVLFRQEVAKSVQWAGNPTKPVQVGPNGVRLTPRKSFAAWQEVVRNHCQDWTPSQMQTAEALRMTLLEVVLRMSDANLKERARAQEHQELLIAELNHRVRNILNLIKGLISQSGESAKDVASYTKVIGGRVHALARAHDQITKENWTPASFVELIATEADAYFQKKSERLIIEGTDAFITPAAFTTISLVVHELMTNSMKYGALCDSKGSITINIKEDPDGALRFIWQESGGPPVQAPKRRGFGSTVIERSIPFELQGQANIQFQLTGLRAEFVVPAEYVASFSPQGEIEKPKSESAKSMNLDLDSALIVEDNMIIALDAELILEDLGVKAVTVCSSVPQALECLKKEEINLALLDVNLGNETSEKIADILIEKNIPFAFATGYGETKELSKRYPNVPVVQKPFDVTSVSEALSKLF